MKKIVKIGVVLIVLLTGLVSQGSAEFCRSNVITCGNTYAGYGFECGGTLQEFVDNWNAMVSAVCESLD